ncbi:cysteine hydrolase [Thermosipho sp. 1063]|uniref:cysteine hydrolase family protein n=1 Tax=unclassified Thermosipho (in: thermotogales) TaxID=2676525 RepID=UPI0009492BAA|nr:MULTISPECIES: isochorismatase family cysteine hydrolase [unclassified Thermosipho (in: thermotogales)]ANQ53209.1 cysteine hydrolase [Thermosipho sp. 1070]APT71659.1 cysteine hydrolase [Thermosipho sp. 1063]OOC45176.1 cysteine hydrolase [Thermosipho sp. 1074]
MKALIIIDMQNDFAKEGGTLYFKGAENVIPHILRLISNAKKENIPIILTQDWHEENDEEFKIWTKHCVKNTDGAKIIDEILKLIKDYNNVYFIKKTRYSAFYNTNFDKIIKKLNITEVDLAGLVSNICVLFTAEELRNRDIKVNLFKNATNSYDQKLHELSLRLMDEVLKINIKEV